MPSEVDHPSQSHLSREISLLYLLCVNQSRAKPRPRGNHFLRPLQATQKAPALSANILLPPYATVGGVCDSFGPEKFRNIGGGKHSTGMLNKSAIKAFSNAILLRRVGCHEL